MASKKQEAAARKRAKAQGISYNSALADVTSNPAMIAMYLSATEIQSCDSSSSSSYDSGSSSSYDSSSSSY